MYRVITEQRGATVARRPAARRGRRLGDGPRRPSARRPRTADARLALQPEQPDRPGRARRRDRGAPRRARGRRGRRRPRRRRSSSSTRPTPSSSARRCSRSRLDHPNLDRRPDGEQGLRASPGCGSASRSPGRETIARIAPYRPPGSVSTISVTIVTEALLDPTALRGNLERVERERDRLRDGADRGSAGGRAVGDQLPPRRLRIAGRAAAVAEGLLRRGLVPRTFGAGHPLADSLRLTVRDRRRTTA